MIEKRITLSEAARRAGFDRVTLRLWLRQDGFKMPQAGHRGRTLVLESEVGPHNQAQKLPRASNSLQTLNKTTVAALAPRLVVSAFQCGEECSCTSDEQLLAALADLLALYDRLDAGSASWSGADARRLAEIRKLTSSLRRKE